MIAAISLGSFCAADLQHPLQSQPAALHKERILGAPSSVDVLRTLRNRACLTHVLNMLPVFECVSALEDQVLDVQYRAAAADSKVHVDGRDAEAAAYKKIPGSHLQSKTHAWREPPWLVLHS